MGFWHTGYLEFHEPTVLDGGFLPGPPAPPQFPCSECDLVFASQRDRRAHLFDGHSSRRPMLLFRGRECGRTRLTVTSPSVPSDWRAADVEFISLNGRPSTVEATAHYLASTRSGVQTVTAGNGPLKRSFEFDFCLADDDDLHLVDQALEEMVTDRLLSPSAIDVFLMKSRTRETARRYVTGLVEYLYGVLAREGLNDRVDAGAGGGRRYEEHYNRAVDILGSFDRPAPEAICGLVAFHYNQFELAARKTNSHRISDVAARFSHMKAGASFVTSSLLDRSHGSLDQTLSDSDTENLIVFCAMALDGSECGQLEGILAELQQFRPEDQFKIRMIASEALLAEGDLDGARSHSEALRNYRDTFEWYERFRGRLHEVGR